MNVDPTSPATPAGDEHRHDAARELLRVVREIHARGWCLGTSGNFSVVLERRPLRLLITPSGHDKGRVEADDLVTVDRRGRRLEDDGRGGGKPSAETLLHCVLARRGAGAVLHTHSVPGTLVSEHFATAGGLTLQGYEMLKGLAGVDSHETEVFLPVLANSQDMTALAGELERLLEEAPRPGLLLAGHGLYAWGRDLEEAHRHVEILEFLLECVARRCVFAPLT